MDFIKFSSATCTVFPIANSKSGGQLVNEQNLRARESVSTDPNITYTSHVSYTHSMRDFAISMGQNQNSISISGGRCVLNGHYFESVAPIEVDILGKGLHGKLKVGLRAYYSTDATLSGSLLPEDNNYMFTGIRVVILPESDFILPSDSPDDEMAVTAHLYLGSFVYNDRILADTITQNENKVGSLPADRVVGLGKALEGKYLTSNAIYPSGIFTMEGRGSKDGSLISKPTWSNSTNSLMLWDNNTEVTTTKPSLQSAQFNTYPNGNRVYTLLQIPHKQIDGYYEAVPNGSGTTYRRLYFPTKNLTLPLADFDRGTAGTVDRNYTNKIKDLAKKFDTIYLLPNGKQRAFIEEITSVEGRDNQLPQINGNWNYGDYVIVRNDLSLELTNEPISTVTTMYVVLGPYVIGLELLGEVYQGDKSVNEFADLVAQRLADAGLQGTDINSVNVDTTATLVTSSADFAEMYYTNSLDYLLGKKDKSDNLYHIHFVGTGYSYKDVASLPDTTIVGSLANDGIDSPARTAFVGADGKCSLTNNMAFEVRANSQYTIKIKKHSDPDSSYVTAVMDTALENNPDYIEFKYTKSGAQTIKVYGGDVINFEFSDTSYRNTEVDIQMYYSHSSHNAAYWMSRIYLVNVGLNTYDVYVYTGDANVGFGGYVKRCSSLYCEGISGADRNNRITKAIDNYIAGQQSTEIPLVSDANGEYLYRLSTKAVDGKITDYMTVTYTFTSGNDHSTKQLTRIYKIPYPNGIQGLAGYSKPILLTGVTFLATEDTVGGFLNIDPTNSSLEDNGYIYVDADGHLRLLDYELLRSAELAYILNEDKLIGEGLTYEEIQYQLDNEVNNRVAFPMDYIENTELKQFVVNLTLNLASSEDAQTINIDNIDERYGTAVILTIKGTADSNTTINISNCAKIKVNPNISGTPNINIFNSGICYDAKVFNTVKKMQNISIWYEKYSESDPNLVVNGMTITDLDVASFVLGQDSADTAYINTMQETVRYDLTFGDYNFTYGLRSITLSPDGSIAEVGIYVKNQSTTQSSISVDANTPNSSRIYLAKFRLPQSVNLQYPISKVNANIRIDGTFISGYETTDNNKYILATNTFSALVNKYDIADITSYEEHSGVSYAVGTISYRIDSSIYETSDISVDSDVVLSTDVNTVMDAVLRSFDNNAYHIFEGHSIPIID